MVEPADVWVGVVAVANLESSPGPQLFQLPIGELVASFYLGQSPYCAGSQRQRQILNFSSPRPAALGEPEQ